MTAPRNQPDTFQGMLDWLEGELRQVKAQVADVAEQTRQSQAQIWELTDQGQHAETGAVNLAAQVNALAALPEDLRALRERVERLQSLMGQEKEQGQLLGRQLHAEMQTERNDRNDLRRRTEFAEQAATAFTEKLGAVDEAMRRLQDGEALINQRLEQVDINDAAIESRVAANAESLRRSQSEGRSLAGNQDRYDRALEDQNQRLDQLVGVVNRLQEDSQRLADLMGEVESMRGRLETIRVSNDAITERSEAVARSHEDLKARLEEFGRILERHRVRADQQERALADLRLLAEEVREHAAQEAERFHAFEEKGRRRQIADLEQEIRELKNFSRRPANG